MGCGISSGCRAAREAADEPLAPPPAALDKPEKKPPADKPEKKPPPASGHISPDARRRKEDQYRRTSALEDPLGIGKESESMSAPSRWLLLMGTSSSGKSSLVRQLKFAYDGLDDAEAQRYKKEVHKAALDACREVIKRVPSLDDEHQAAADRILKLRRRNPISAEVAADLKDLWSDKAVVHALENMRSHQFVLTCKHFIPRLDELAAPDFAPDLQDVLYVSIPTAGLQETRINNFPGGPLSVFEVKVDTRNFVPKRVHLPRRTTEDQSSALFAFDQGLPPPATDYDPSDMQLAVSTKRENSLCSEAYMLKKKCLEISSKMQVPCIILLSMVDLLYSMQLPDKMTPASLRTLIESQLSASIPASLASNTTLLTVSLTEGNSNFSDFQDTLMKHIFPDDDDEGEAVGLEDAVYLSLLAFVDAEKKVLTMKGSIPMAKMQSEKLNLQDHIWIQSLPDPLPNPKKASAEMARRMGKESPVPMQARLWKALVTLSDHLGAFQPDTLGSLYAVPLLVCTGQGALLLVICQMFGSRPSTHLPQKLVWQTLSLVAQKVASKLPAIERYKFSAIGSYKLDADAIQSTIQPKELQPVKWLVRLRDYEASLQNLTAGTYVCAFYIFSALDGFQILLHHSDHFMPPVVKISKNAMSADEWAQICQFGDAVNAEAFPDCPDDWAGAKSWMGPDVASEDQFTMFQKFMFGITALRQRLNRQCGAMHDNLRYSQAAHAAQSLFSLGYLNTHELVTLGHSGEIQLIIVTRVYNIAVDENIPSGMNWYPLPMFESCHYRRFFQRAFETFTNAKQFSNQCMGRGTSTSSASRPPSSVKHELRGSDLRGSAMSSTKSDDGQTSDGPRMSIASANRIKVFDLFVHDRERMESLWESIRWTKHLLRWAIDVAQGTIEHASVGSKAAPEVLRDDSVRLYNSVVAEAAELLQSMRRHAEVLADS